jgi:hypothetical protein
VSGKQATVIGVVDRKFHGTVFALGAVVGKALETLQKRTDVIQVLVTLQ